MTGFETFSPQEPEICSGMPGFRSLTRSAEKLVEWTLEFCKVLNLVKLRRAPLGVHGHIRVSGDAHLHTSRLQLQRPATGIRSLSLSPLYQLRTSAIPSGSRSWMAAKTAILTLLPAV